MQHPVLHKWICPPSRANSIDESNIKKSINSLIVSQSNPDFRTIDDKTLLSHTNLKHQKKRPAPPPPSMSSATLPNKSFSLQKTSDNNENVSNESVKNDSNLKFEKVSQTPQMTDENKPVLKVSKSITHVRQNSGSDSSGYHESVLSSDSPESSSATTLHKTGSSTEKISSNNNNNNNTKQMNDETHNILNQKSGTKKRRAPPPPTNYSTQDPGAQQVKPINGHKSNVNDISDESKVVLECMSDISLPLSTSSSSSGTASDINNRSLSPIVITQTNGSSTPLQTSVNLEENCLDSESKQCSSHSDKTIDSQTQESDETLLTKQLKTDLENYQQLNESVVSHEVDQKIELNGPDIDIRENDLNQPKEETIVESETPNEWKASDNECTSKSRESPPKAEVSCTAPALSASHDTELSVHDCSEQVAEKNIDNVVDNEKPGSIDMPVISDRIQLNTCPNNSRALNALVANNRLHSSRAIRSTNPKSTSGLHGFNGCGHTFSNFRSYLDDIRRTYLHEMTGDGQLMLLPAV